LISLGYLWRKDQKELLQEMIDHGMEAILVKIASMGLKPHVHLGRSIADLYGQFMELVCCTYHCLHG
jgi:diphthine-ammonia ligase